MGVLHRDHLRRARTIIDQGQLAEVLTHTEHAEDDFAPVLADENDFHPALADNEQGIAGIVLEQNHAAARIELFAREFGKALQLRAIQSIEKRNGRDEVGSRCRQNQWEESGERTSASGAPKTGAKLVLGSCSVKPASRCVIED